MTSEQTQWISWAIESVKGPKKEKTSGLLGFVFLSWLCGSIKNERFVLNRTEQYGLQLVAYLACYGTKRVRAKELSKATGVPLTYLSKILSRLRKRGIVSAEKGWGGGFKLAEEVLCSPIIVVLDALGKGLPTTPSFCLFGWSKCSSKNPCPLHPEWEKLSAHINKVYRETTIQALGDRLRKKITVR
ncbi:MAG: Rrf2 family transcriptional regulator [Deltaproteobacteria bacterium]|nr:Rrf2 family transcriptional regulator [Deltaproteobacteria bacterium]